mmetsp:Transcript_14621/g.41679  ORF Transcript_14621/g.41679 Transcript_14621/m.41679 type:complete len:335 (+) Transcript_14621:1134-2138(+)
MTEAAWAREPVWTARAWTAPRAVLLNETSETLVVDDIIDLSSIPPRILTASRRTAGVFSGPRRAAWERATGTSASNTEASSCMATRDPRWCTSAQARTYFWCSMVHESRRMPSPTRRAAPPVHLAGWRSKNSIQYSTTFLLFTDSWLAVPISLNINTAAWPGGDDPILVPIDSLPIAILSACSPCSPTSPSAILSASYVSIAASPSCSIISSTANVITSMFFATYEMREHNRRCSSRHCRATADTPLDSSTARRHNIGTKLSRHEMYSAESWIFRMLSSSSMPIFWARTSPFASSTPTKLVSCCPRMPESFALEEAAFNAVSLCSAAKLTDFFG